MRGVMAHELAHVKHRDILISTVSATMAGAISALANFAMLFGGRDENGRPANPIAGIAVALLAPIAGALIQMANSRAREFEADRGGVTSRFRVGARRQRRDRVRRCAGIAYRTMRRLGTAEWLIAKLVKKAPPHVGHVLACAFALLVDDEAHAAYAPFTVVDQAVSAIGARREFVFAKGLVNAVLRNFLRERGLC